MTFLTQQFNKRRLRLLLALLTVGVLTAILTRPAHAAEFRSGDTAVVGTDEVIDDDLFISGQTVTVDGVVTGNLFAAGAIVTVNGTVEGSLFMAGRTLAANGTVNGSLFASSYSMSVGPEADTDGNLYFSGFSLTTEQGSQVGRGLYGGGYQMILNGEVANDVNVGVGALELNGIVGGDMRGNVGTPEDNEPNFFMPSFEGDVAVIAPGLRVGENAQVGGDVAVDVVQPEEITPVPFYSLANERTRWVIGELIALLIVGFLLLWIRPRWLRRTSTVAQERWLPSLGIGLLAIIVAIILLPLAVGLIILLTIAGDWISLGQLTTSILGLGLTGLVFATAVFLFLVGIVSKIIVAFLCGYLLVQRPADTAVSTWDFIALAVGIVIYILLRALPFGIGFIIGLIITLLGVGAFFLTLRRTPRPRTVTVVTKERPREAPA